jgi:ribosomal protein L17
MAAPLGNKNAVKNRPWAEVINRALIQGDGQRLRTIAEKLLTLAENGDIQALKEVGDRLDGKPAQQVQLSGDADAPLKIIHESK